MLEQVPNHQRMLENKGTDSLKKRGTSTPYSVPDLVCSLMYTKLIVFNELKRKIPGAVAIGLCHKTLESQSLQSQE